MDEVRQSRYADKISMIELRGRQVHEWTHGLGAADLGQDARSRLAVYKALQELAAAALDLCAMRLRDTGVTVKDDYNNVSSLEARGELDPETAKVLREANGLRNRLVRAYDNLRDDLVLGFVANRLLVGFARRATAWINP